ncbi:putative cyclase family protein [Candidatus Nitrososphaera gargensis Ga9.2]|uniref:Putative cyclase family protein n=1 Tax=Nitrososphaera gargensis (strain Ga9.2) TaxID=1237085 RepID=K0II01_NITGG|nr:cyclase family protein [Candidatus Nitrososphaera gargensis]AFU57577.1 putative cyclase family protein [Candidatus Nitrososphaera gargensis Ga9.2]
MKLSRIHDLTRTISEDMQVYPGDPRPKFEPHVTIKEDGKANVTRITLGSHTGTHVDAPWHFLQDGNGIDMEPLDKFVGEAAIIDASGKSSITAGDFSCNDIRSGDIVLIHTGTGDRPTDFAYLDVSAAKWITEHGVRCVGIDTPSVEKYGVKDAPVHKMLLASNIGIIENLVNLEQFAGSRMFFVCLPLPLKGIDGSPARAVLFDIVK